MPDPSPIQDNPLDQFSLSGRVFVITGASSGIGREITRFLAGAGAAVVGIARRQDKLDHVIEQIIESGGRARSVCADLADRPGIGDVAAQCKDAFGHIDGVVNAAGINLRQSVDEVTIEGWDATLNLNLCVPFFFSREFIPGMVENRFGRIINIASLQSFRAFSNSMAYGASKGGICQLTRAMAQAWSPQGITCNAIAPGFFPNRADRPHIRQSRKRTLGCQPNHVGTKREIERSVRHCHFLRICRFRLYHRADTLHRWRFHCTIILRY